MADYESVMPPVLPCTAHFQQPQYRSVMPGASTSSTVIDYPFQGYLAGAATYWTSHNADGTPIPLGVTGAMLVKRAL